MKPGLDLLNPTELQTGYISHVVRITLHLKIGPDGHSQDNVCLSTYCQGLRTAQKSHKQCGGDLLTYVSLSLIPPGMGLGLTCLGRLAPKRVLLSNSSNKHSSYLLRASYGPSTTLSSLPMLFHLIVIINEKDLVPIFSEEKKQVLEGLFHQLTLRCSEWALSIFSHTLSHHFLNHGSSLDGVSKLFTRLCLLPLLGTQHNPYFLFSVCSLGHHPNQTVRSLQAGSMCLECSC